MKNRIAMLLVAIFTAGLLSGCQPAFEPVYPEGVTREKLEAISAEYDATLSWYHIDGYGSYYLAHENGYDIFYHFWLASSGADNLEEYLKDWGFTILDAYTYKIGSASFYPCTEERLLVYDNGTFRPLGEYYSKGLISEDTILLAKERFDEYMEILKKMDHEEYWRRERNFKRSAYDLSKEIPEFAEYLKGSQSREYPILQELFQAASED